MNLKTDIQAFAELIAGSQTILILQPEKPDTDSLTSSLALEQILGDQGKDVVLYCRDDLPRYISYFEGADRVHDRLPKQFDLTILVDTGGPQQIMRTLEKHRTALSKKPFVVIDHHPTRTEIGLETLTVIDPSSTSTCELVVKIARTLDWNINADAANLIIPGILADTRNLSIPTVQPEAFEAMADMIRAGGDVYKSHQAFWNSSALTPELLMLKARLLSRMELFCDGKIAVVCVTPAELKEYAEAHDPSDLVIYDMQNLRGVGCAVVFRDYGGKIKISTRAKLPVAAKTCQHFGGGGHDRASGCQFNDRDVSEVKEEFVAVLCQNIKDYEALQHTN